MKSQLSRNASARVIAAALNHLAATLPQMMRARIVTTAIEVARQIEKPLDRVLLLIESAKLLDRADKTTVLDEALDVATLFGFEQAAWAIGWELHGDLREKAVAIAEKLEGYEYHWAMAGLLLHHDPEGATHHLYNSTSSHEYGIIYQAKYVAGSLATEALAGLANDVLAIDSDELRSEGIVALAPWLKGEVLGATLDAARKLGEDLRYTVLAALVANVPKHEQEVVLQNIFSWVRTCTSELELSEVLSKIAPLVSGQMRKKAFQLASLLETKSLRVKTMAALAMYMPPAEKEHGLSMALAAVHEIEEMFKRAEALSIVSLASGQRSWALRNDDSASLMTSLSWPSRAPAMS